MSKDRRSRRNYWLKLDKNFFKRHDIAVIESMPNGKDYVLFYLKLLAESISHDGHLRFSETIPYNEQMLAAVTNTNVDIVRSAIKIFSKLNLIEVLDDDTYFLSELQKMVGSETEHAKQKRVLRAKKQKQLTTNRDNVSVVSPNCLIEKELEKEKDIEKEFLLGAHTHPREKTKKNNNATEFIVPNLEDITDFISKNNLKVNPMKFYNYYKAKDWNLKEGLKMSDWKAVVNVWHVNAEEQNNNKATNNNEPEWLDEYIKEFLGE